MTSIGGQVGWTTFSDARFKQDIKHDVPGLVFITQLQPVTYMVDVAGIENYYAVLTGQKATETNPPAATAVQSGFLAQDVEKLATSLGYQFSGVDKPGQ